MPVKDRARLPLSATGIVAVPLSQRRSESDSESTATAVAAECREIVTVTGRLRVGSESAAASLVDSN